MTPSVLVLSHLFPSDARPGSGPFVADEVDLVRAHTPLRVVAPTRWVPPAPRPQWRRERAVRVFELWRGVPVFRPRVLALPGGGLEVESRLWPSRLWPLVRRLAATHPVSFVHAHFGVPDGFAALALARRLGVPALVTLYGDDVLAYARKPRVRGLVKAVVRGADHLIAVSNELRERAIELGADPADVTLIPSSAPASFRPLARDDARARLGLAPDERWVVWIGSAAPKKRPHVALAAFALAAARDASLRLAMVGDGARIPELRTLAGELGILPHVRFVGYVDRDQVPVWE
ncbi:MAG: glycosyltransferase, partial [Thermoleophilia bacterium]|nr:glycosyltransferase [Thermoleophilia bacterium]